MFDWFRKARVQEEPPEEWWHAIARLEHDMQQLQLSWEETYGKVRRALATLAKRQQREEGAEEPQNIPVNGGTNPHTLGERLRAARARYGRS